MTKINRKDFLTALGACLILNNCNKMVNNANATVVNEENNKAIKLIEAARNQIGITINYDPSYTKIKYPMGDVGREIGVCTDVIIRGYRDALRIDLQELVHKDMASNFSKYPKIWGLKSTDTNIDHRRVPNLRRFLERNNCELLVTNNPKDYKAGDIITQDILGRPHIGIVSNKFNLLKTTPLLIHNVGRGTQEEDFLFAYKITGHYRFGI